MSAVIEQFCESHFAHNSISRARQVQMRRLLAEFEESLGGRTITDARGLDLERFLTARLESLAASTVCRQQYTIRPFFTWAIRHSLIEREQLREIREVPAPRGARKHTPSPYTRDELRKLFAVLDARFPRADQHWVDRFFEGKSPWSRVRRHGERLQCEAMIAAALYGGLRRGEIMRLELDDLAPEHAALPARSRKNREGTWEERKVPIIEPMHVAFAEWHAFRTALQPQITAPEDAPWVRLQRSDFGIKLDAPHRSGDADKHLVRIHSVPHGKSMPKLRWGFHRLRHTCATEMLRSGYKLHVVRKILGHSSLEQTLRYAELLDSDVLAESDRVGGKFARAIATTRNGHGA